MHNSRRAVLTCILFVAVLDIELTVCQFRDAFGAGSVSGYPWGTDHRIAWPQWRRCHIFPRAAQHVTVSSWGHRLVLQMMHVQQIQHDMRKLVNDSSTFTAGAGKSTLIGVLTGMLQPSSGDAWLAGHSVVHEPGTVQVRV